MRFDSPPIEGRFLRRYKRFFADIELPDGTVVTAHCPNTGSLLGCKEPGSPAWLRDSGDPKRKLRMSWQAIRVGDTWVNVDTNLPNRVVFEAIQAGVVPELRGYDEARREVRYGNRSRIDVLLTAGDRPPCYVEVKNTTLAEGGTALFPDAVTSRGLKHLGELREVVRRGERAVQFFFVSRTDVDTFRPADSIDPAYTAALREAASAGVEVLAWAARVAPEGVELDSPLVVDLT
ncbi:MAG TPA: DNA/RNA nuclease SfsA [Planctomycetes bacterium]|nr:DNA/RNA nuclease SfsA [Planctomycetota bacterium]